MTDEEKERAKDALFELIEECKSGGEVGEAASDRLKAVSEAATVLLLID